MVAGGLNLLEFYIISLSYRIPGNRYVAGADFRQGFQSRLDIAGCIRSISAYGNRSGSLPVIGEGEGFSLGSSVRNSAEGQGLPFIAGRNKIQFRIQVAGKLHFRSRIGVQAFVAGYVYVGGIAVGAEIPGGSIGQPALHPVAVAIDQVAPFVEVKGSGPGIIPVAAFVDYEITVAVDRHIGQLGRTGGRRTGMDLVNTGQGHAQPHPHGIGSSPGSARAGGSPDILIEHVFKYHPALLKSGGINIGNIVSYNIHSGLVVPQTRNPRIHGTHHFFTRPPLL